METALRYPDDLCRAWSKQLPGHPDAYTGRSPVFLEEDRLQWFTVGQEHGAFNAVVSIPTVTGAGLLTYATRMQANNLPARCS